MRAVLLAAGFVLGIVAAQMAFRARVRLLEDKAFVKGWAGALRYQDDRDPGVKP